MINKLSMYRFLLILLVSAVGMKTVKAQPLFPATLTTNYPTSNVYTTPADGPGGATSPSFITFTVENTNPYPIKIKAVGFYHIGYINFTSGPFTMNGATYTLWYASSTTPPGTPNINKNNGWNIVATGDPIQGAGNAIIDVIDSSNGLGFIIPPAGCPGSYVRFALLCSKEIQHPIIQQTNPLTPQTWNASGIKLGGTGQHIGIFPGAGVEPTDAIMRNIVVAGNTVLTQHVGGFRGSITVDTADLRPPAPTLTANPNPVCLGDSVTLKANISNEIKCVFANPIYRWTWPGGQATGDSIRVPLNQNTQFECIAVSMGKFSDPSYIRVRTTKPEPPFVTGKFDYCVNEQYQPITVIADSATWYYSPEGGSALPVPPTINTTLGPQRDTYYVAQWRGGCGSDRTMVIFTASAKPAVPQVTTPNYYCKGDPADALEAVGQNLVWYYFPVGGLPTTIVPIPSTGKIGKSEYYVASSNNGCESERAEIEVYIEERPNGMIVPSRERICQGDTISITYYGSAFPSSEYRWFFPKESEHSGDPDSMTRGPIVVRFDSVGTFDIKLLVGITGCHSPYYSQSVTVDSIPFAIISANQEVCQHAMELVTVSYYDVTIDSFIWDFGANGTASHYATDQGPYGITWSEPGMPVISLKVVQGACSDTLYDTIEVRPVPDARIQIDNPSSTGVYCAGDSLRLRALTINSGSQYKWGPSRFFDMYTDLPAVYSIVDYSSYVTLHVEDQYGCKNADSVMMKTEPCCDLTFPSAFSPNGDGKNDFFHLLNVNNMENYHRTNGLNYDVITFQVKNRWGVTVFESANELRGWDGMFNGKVQDLGTYYWFVSYMCGGKQVSEKGEVVLVR